MLVSIGQGINITSGDGCPRPRGKTPSRPWRAFYQPYRPGSC